MSEIHKKYQKQINEALNGYVTDFNYQSAMEVLRYCERQRGISLSLNMSCPTCLIDLLRLFNSLK